ncbi:MAG: class I SAM-dependent methyltransferase [Acidobacteria bacterium]|nr:class I SAM-dependent methyltransferase [Acidobacteriota bacterium]
MSPNLPHARGYFNFLNVRDGKLVIAGWLIHPETALDSFRLLIDGETVQEAPLTELGNISDAFPFIAHSARSGFNVSVPYAPYAGKPGLRRIDVIGLEGGNEIAGLGTCYSEDLYPEQKFPENLVARVANKVSENFFKASSLTSFRNFTEAIGRHADISKIKNMLDWGCGCGRLAVMFANGTDIPGIFGCDIDAESVEWCRGNLKGDYRVIPPMPPTGYGDSFFDLVLSASVFTHLTKENQLEWLKEMRRIIAPGGLLVATVHGEFAAYFKFGGKAEEALGNGINDAARDDNLSGIAPADYYRGTFQKKSYTEQAFGKYFNILEYAEAGSMNFQDLIVMRKPSKRRPFWKLR